VRTNPRNLLKEEANADRTISEVQGEEARGKVHEFRGLEGKRREALSKKDLIKGGVLVKEKGGENNKTVPNCRGKGKGGNRHP